MVKRIMLVLLMVGATLVVALLSGLSGEAFAQLQDDGQPCPPECVTDTMEIVTWYPSPYSEYEELRLYPKRNDEESQCNSSDQLGLIYYNKDDQALKVCWKSPVSGLYSWEKVVLGQGGYWQLSGNDISNTNSGKVTIITTDSNKVSLEASGAVRLGNYGTRPTCSNTILGALIYDTTEKRPYVCALNASNSPVWKPLDSDYDRDGITDAVDFTDTDPNDATAVEANVETDKTFYARGGSRRTGTLAVEDVNVCATQHSHSPPSPDVWYSCSKFGSKAICTPGGNVYTYYNQCSCAPGYTLKMWVDTANALYYPNSTWRYPEVYYCKKD